MPEEIVDQDPNTGNPDVGGGNDNNASLGWRAQLPGDLRDNASLTKFEKVGNLGQAYVELERKLGNSVQLPGENATAEELSNLFSRLGRPEAADKYELQRPESPKDAQGNDLIPYDEDAEKLFRQKAFESGLTGQQAKQVFDFYNAQVVGAHNRLQEIDKQLLAEAETQLKKDWGDKYDGNKERADRAFSNLFTEDVRTTLTEKGMLTSPAFIRAMHDIGQKIGEDGLVDGGVPNANKRQTDSSGRPMLDFSKSMPRMTGGA